MSTVELDDIRTHYESLRDDELLRAAVLEGGTLVDAAQSVVQQVVLGRLGTAGELVAREREAMGRFWGRIQQVKTFSRLRGPNEPVLGGRDISPTDGMILLSDRGLGFVPSSPPPARELFPELPGEGPLGEWFDELLAEAKVPEPERDARFVYRLPLSLRARLDPTSAWIPRSSIEGLELRKLDLRVHVSDAGDAVCRVPEPASEFLHRWGTTFEVEIDERDDESVKDRLRGWLGRD